MNAEKDESLQDKELNDLTDLLGSSRKSHATAIKTFGTTLFGA